MRGWFEDDEEDRQPDPEHLSHHPVAVAAITLIWLNIAISVGLVLMAHGGGEQAVWIFAWVVVVLGLHFRAEWAPIVGVLVAAVEYVWGLVTAGEFLSTTLVIGVLLVVTLYKSGIGTAAGR